MPLNHSQKKYLKKNFKDFTPAQLAAQLKVQEKEVLDYIKERWGNKGLKNSTETTPSFSLNLWFRNNRLILLVLLLLIVAVYGMSLNNAFLSDDIAEIKNNPNVASLDYAITSHPFSFIRLVFYWLALHLGGLNPAGFRLINLFFHTGSVFLLYLILQMIIKSQKIAFFVAAVFAIHPAISEAVVWISGGSYPQYTFFFLLSFLFYILSDKKRFFYLLSSIFYFLSFMSHPVMPAGLFVIFPLYEFSFGNLRKKWLKVIPFALIFVAYIFINLSGLPERETTLQNVHYQQKGIDNPFVLIPIAVSSYLELIFFPKTLTLYHSELSFGLVEFWIRVLITVLLLTYLGLTFKKNRVIFFWLSWFWISLAPTLTPFRLNWIVAERYLYLPMVGILTSLALVLDKISAKKKLHYLIYGLFALILLLLSARTIIRNIDWKSEDNLWLAAGKTSPSSPNNHNNLGDVYGRRGDKQTALREFQTAISLKPNYADAYHNLANTYRELGQLDKALENYQKAIEFNPRLWQSYQNIAAIYFSQKKYDLAVDNLQKGIQINPKNVNLRNNLGIVYLLSGQKDKAKEIFTLVHSIDPQNQVANQGIIEANK